MPERRLIWTREEIILACALIAENGWKALVATDERVKELSVVLRAARIHPVDERPANFRSADSVGRKTTDIATRHPDYPGKLTNGNRLDAEVLRDFLDDTSGMIAAASAIRANLSAGTAAGVAAEEIDADGLYAKEGTLLLSVHLRRERSPKLRSKKIEQCRRDSIPIACEVCAFDFAKVYGDRGRDYIEVHHVLPLHASGPTTTRLRDLALLCSNCHRMIHRGRPWLTPGQLRNLLPAAWPIR